MKRRKKIKQLDQREVGACIDRLEQLIAGLKSGNIGIEDNGELVALSPSGLIDFELRVEQLQRRETLRVELTWQREPSSAQSREPAAPTDRAMKRGSEPPSASEPPPSEPPAPGYAAPESEAPSSTHTLDRLATAEVQRWFMAARVLGSDGRWHLDQDRLIVSLESAGVDALTQQELYAFALQADADSRTSLLSDRLLDAIRRVGDPALSSDGEPAAPSGAL